MTSFYCVYCGEVFAKEDVSTPMESEDGNPLGWVWVRETCPRCHRGCDDWYASTTRPSPVDAVRHGRVRRKGRYVGHWEMMR